MITPVVHHISTRRTCNGCIVAVFMFADEIDDTTGELTGRHFCRNCAPKEARGEDTTAWQRR